MQVGSECVLHMGMSDDDEGRSAMKGREEKDDCMNWVLWK